MSVFLGSHPNPAIEGQLKIDPLAGFKLTTEGVLAIFSDPSPNEIHSPTVPWSSNSPAVLITKQPAWIEMVQYSEKYHVVTAHVPLNEMLGLASNLGPLVAVNSGPSVAVRWTR
jgi:hypothetical protein